MRVVRSLICASVSAATLALGACESFPIMSAHTAKPSTDDADGMAAADNQPQSQRQRPRHVAPDVTTIPKPVAAPVQPLEREAGDAEIGALVGSGLITATLPPQPLPQFLDTVFGDLLKIPYSTGPKVASRSEIISVGGVSNMTRKDFLRLLQTSLKNYGLKIYIRGGSVAVLDDAEMTGQTAVILRSRSSADTPAGSRTVIQFYQLATLEANSIAPLIKDVVPAGRAVKITPDPLSNTLVITGSGRDVAETIEAIAAFDKPIFAGAKVARFEPAFWSAEAFAKALHDSLVAEGYKVADTLVGSRAVIILPMATNNQVLVFCADQAILDRALFWADQLDRPSAVGDQKSTFIYTVRNTDATSLGALLNGTSTAADQSFNQPPVGVPGTPPANGASSATTPSTGALNSRSLTNGGGITIDAIGNRILFTGTATQFAQTRSLLEQLDVPPPQVLVEVTIAEVTLTDSTQAGLEWFFSKALGNGTLSGGTQGGLSIGNTGLNLTFTGPNLTAAFNAFASNNKVNILSKPRLWARSGSDAQLEVGSDIPIITSQQAASVQTAGTTSVLQSVSYRQTGIILKIKPIVYGSRVDMQISQEVSSQQANGNAAISSPIILDRSVTTQVSVSEGSTAVISGLMDSEYSKGNNGVPFIKDLPLVGEAFRTDTVSGNKTDLVILVTPHIVRNDDEMSELTGKLTGELNDAFRVGRAASYTLTTFASGHNLGIDLPPAVVPDALKGHRPVETPTPANPAAQP
jgi:general secretion pathway protein D